MKLIQSHTRAQLDYKTRSLNSIEFFFLDVQNSIQKIVELFKFDSRKLESINNYTQNRFEFNSVNKIVKLN